MNVIILILIAYFIFRFLKNRSSSTVAKTITLGNLDQYPNTLPELANMKYRTNDKSVAYHCHRKYCELAMNLYNEGKLSAKHGDPHGAAQVLEEILTFVRFSENDSSWPLDDEFNFRCLKTGMDMIEDFHNQKKTNPDIHFPVPNEFIEKAMFALSEYYNEGKFCPRNPALARKFLRMRIDVSRRLEKSISSSALWDLMEVPEGNDFGPEEISKLIALEYGMDQIKLNAGKINRNSSAQLHQQSAELLFQMNLDNIGSSDITVMLSEYQKCADAGNAYAQSKLGSFYIKGRFVEKDISKGLDLLEKAVTQDLYLAAKELFDYYDSLAHPYGGGNGGATKEQLKEYERLYSFWGNRCDKIRKVAEVTYANHLAEYFHGGVNKSTCCVERAEAVSSDYDTDSTYRGHSGLTDRESPFTVLDLPNVIKDAYGNVYEKNGIGVESADYYGQGLTITIHVSDLGNSGRNATTSDGYFSW